MHSNTNDNAFAALNLLLESLDKVPCSERVIGFDTENPVLPNGFSEKISVITVQMHATMNENNLTVAKKRMFKTCSHPECPNCDRCKGGYCNRMN